jgi:amino acid permease
MVGGHYSGCFLLHCESSSDTPQNRFCSIPSQGTEIVAIAAGEAKNPRRNLPKAIKRVYVRILLFYIGGVSVIGLLVPSNEPRLDLKSGTAAASPFVIAIQRAVRNVPIVILSTY